MPKRGPRNLRRVHPGMDVALTREQVKGGAQAPRTMVDFAEDLGRLLGTAQAKASNWLNQRKNVIDELTQLRDTATELLAQLTGDEASSAARPRSTSRRGRPRGSQNGTAPGQGPRGARKGGRRRMSAAARKAVSERMRKYWAERRKAKSAKA